MHEAPIISVAGLNLDLSAIIMILVSMIIVILIAVLSTRNLSVRNPSKAQNFMEWIVDFVYNTIASTMDMKKARAFISLGLTIIMFIFISNILGLPFAVITEHPTEAAIFGKEFVSAETAQAAIEKGEKGAHVLWWKSPTADISVNLGLALVVFFLVHFLGATRNTKNYIKSYFQPYWFFFPLNLISEIVKPVTLSIRLFANIFAGEILISTILMAGIFGIPMLAVWQGFSLLIGAIQAFLFTILTMVYIAQSTAKEEV